LFVSDIRFEVLDCSVVIRVGDTGFTGLPPLSWIHRSRSLGDLRVLRQGQLIEQARSPPLPTPTF